MKKQQIKVEKTAHYYTLNELNESTERVVIALHGYGQLASRLIQKFNQLPKHNYIIAPEGLSRFYWSQKEGTVGASWMTKEDRLEEIEDYSVYIYLLYRQVIAHAPDNIDIVLFGFSQGGTTAVRSLLQKDYKIDRLVLWGSQFPEDIDYTKVSPIFFDVEKYCAYGDSDEYLTKARLKAHENLCAKYNINYKALHYEGGHRICRKTLASLFQSWDIKKL